MPKAHWAACTSPLFLVSSLEPPQAIRKEPCFPTQKADVGDLMTLFLGAEEGTTMLYALSQDACLEQMLLYLERTSPFLVLFSGPLESE